MAGRRPAAHRIRRSARSGSITSPWAGAGYEWIGLDHFALPGDALTAAWKADRLHRNFNGYTTMSAAHLVGAGMSAIGEVAGCQVENAGDLAGWDTAIAGGDFATVRGHRLTSEDRRRRAAILSLMCRLELPLARAEGLEVGLERLLAYAEDGLVEQRGDSVRVTRAGRYFLRRFAPPSTPTCPTTGAPAPCPGRFERSHAPHSRGQETASLAPSDQHVPTRAAQLGEKMKAVSIAITGAFRSPSAAWSNCR